MGSIEKTKEHLGLYDYRVICDESNNIKEEVMNSKVAKESELVVGSARKPEKKLFSSLKHQGYMVNETLINNDYTLQYAISIERVHRGFSVHIGCERFIFHERELHFMGTLLANYIRDYRSVRATIQDINKTYPTCMEDLEEFVEGSHQNTCFQRFGSLQVKLGSSGYCIKAVSTQGSAIEWFFSSVAELSDTLYGLITGKLGHASLSATEVPGSMRENMLAEDVVCESDCAAAY